mmetsp:Transcript_83243/g.174214  ORF Transcript_83243/g.174214 Transcript_83243/m.174214 type:complete len:200 (-) Transcript_83243:146-745(-)
MHGAVVSLVFEVPVGVFFVDPDTPRTLAGRSDQQQAILTDQGRAKARENFLSEDLAGARWVSGSSESDLHHTKEWRSTAANARGTNYEILMTILVHVAQCQGRALVSQGVVCISCGLLTVLSLQRGLGSKRNFQSTILSLSVVRRGRSGFEILVRLKPFLTDRPLNSVLQSGSCTFASQPIGHFRPDDCRPSRIVIEAS